MKLPQLVLTTALVFSLTFVVAAQLPQKDSPQPSQKQEDRIEAAHGKLLSAEDKAKEASRLTEAVAPALPAAAASTAPVPGGGCSLFVHPSGRDRIPIC